MARPRLPVELQEAKRRLHRSAEEVENRKAEQVKSEFSGLILPEGLTAKEKKTFWQWAAILDEIGILSDLDVDALARYVKTQSRYLKAEKALSAALDAKPMDLDAVEQAQRIQDRALKAVTACAKSLGMTIDSRAKLIAPKINEEDAPVNKFMELSA